MEKFLTTHININITFCGFLLVSVSTWRYELYELYISGILKISLNKVKFLSFSRTAHWLLKVIYK